MALTPADRITLIRECATLLDKQEWDDIDLVLEQHKLPTSNYAPDTKSAYVRQMIKDAEDRLLQDLHSYLTEHADTRRPGQSPWTGGKVRLFCSHLAAFKDVVSRVGDGLERFGVEPFVAHNSIEPSREWEEVIEAALAECDAMVVFLHPAFPESAWCDQEVGWALGRKRPILPLNYGLHPYGFLGKYQDQPCATAQPHQVVSYIMDWLAKTRSLHARLGPGLVDAFVTSGSWNFTRQVVTYLSRIGSVSDDDLTRMERAARDNVDVRECAIGVQTGPEWVRDFVAARRGPSSAPAWEDPFPSTSVAAWPAEPPF